MMDELPLTAAGVAKTFGGGFDYGRLLPWGRNGRAAEGPRRVVDDVSFEIRRREIFGVIGANGSGKSTLIRIISTLLLPDAGEVRIFGERKFSMRLWLDPTELARRKLGHGRSPRRE